MKVWGAMFAVLAIANCAPTPRIDQRAAQIINATRATRANFVVISNVSIDFENIAPQKFAGGEFHSGTQHRVEDANNRVVADCSKLDGHQLWLPSMTRNSSTEIATGACGIGPFSEEASIRYMGKIAYRFAKADRIQIKDNGVVRTYDVLSNGAIVRNIWREQAGSKKTIYKSEVESYCDRAMPPSAFIETSLDVSYLTNACP
jgi:hypothetical protein